MHVFWRNICMSWIITLQKWYFWFDDLLIKHDFLRNGYYSYVYIFKRIEEVIIYLLLYVDDILMEISRRVEIYKLNDNLNEEFEIKDLGEVKRIIKMDIMRNCKSSKMFLSQSSFLSKMVEQFRILDAKTINTSFGHHLIFLLCNILKLKMRRRWW